MDKTRILQRGEEAKFHIAIKDYDMEANDFGVKLCYGYRRVTVEITKQQMAHGSDEKWYFTFDTDDMIGRVEVECYWQVPDTDYADGYRLETDRQYLCFVADSPCPKLICSPCVDTAGKVTYIRTEQSSIADEYEYLLTAEGDRLITRDNEYILVQKQNNL